MSASLLLVALAVLMTSCARGPRYTKAHMERWCLDREGKVEGKSGRIWTTEERSAYMQTCMEAAKADNYYSEDDPNLTGTK